MTSKDLVIQADWTSRKYRTAWMLTWLMTALFVLPAAASFVLALLGYGVQFILLPASYYIPFVTGMWFVYFGANVVEKFKKTQKDISGISFLNQEVVDDIGGNSGGQPEGSDNP